MFSLQAQTGVDCMKVHGSPVSVGILGLHRHDEFVILYQEKIRARHGYPTHACGICRSLLRPWMMKTALFCALAQSSNHENATETQTHQEAPIVFSKITEVISRLSFPASVFEMSLVLAYQTDCYNLVAFVLSVDSLSSCLSVGSSD